MGNEQSQIPGLEIEEKAVEVTDFWTHHSATVNSGNVSDLSVFIGEPLVGGSLWINHTPLEKSSKNLMLHRHPCILKYVSSWHKGSKYFLAVEDVKPLSHVLPSLNTLQICIGLHSVLKALCFLHTKAHASHNNVCTASIYVTEDGNWKLGGMEYLMKFDELSAQYLTRTKVHRYQKAIDPNEDDHVQTAGDCDFIDSYAFSVLILEIFKKGPDDDIICLTNFKEFCKSELQNTNVSLRPKISSLLDHPFFNHEFIKIYSFLIELPLKSDADKTQFFTNLHSKLKTFDETTVGNLLAGLLLSRMVLLNKTAQVELVPYLLCPRQETELSNAENLFSIDNFQTYIVPKLLKIICVRDAQIRLLLLDNFRHFMSCFSKDQLRLHILPELLVGIKDTNDHLVSVTLRTLADLVPILGSSAVIGGNRAKLFNDGRPMTYDTATTSFVMNRQRSRRNSRRAQEDGETDMMYEENIERTCGMNENGPLVDGREEEMITLQERPRPDGEEDETTSTGAEEEDGIERSVIDDLENWEDWDANEEGDDEEAQRLESIGNNNLNGSTNNLLLLEPYDLTVQNISEINDVNQINNSNNNKKRAPLHLPDISELDIKNQKNDSDKKSNDDRQYESVEDIDFFRDMEPVIETANMFLVNDLIETKRGECDRFSVKESENHLQDGWDDDWN